MISFFFTMVAMVEAAFPNSWAMSVIHAPSSYLQMISFFTFMVMGIFFGVDIVHTITMKWNPNKHKA